MIRNIIGNFTSILFFGFVFTIVLDCLYFIALKNTYFEFYKIEQNFNPFFMDNQNLFIFLSSVTVWGYLLVFNRFAKFFGFVYLVCLLAIVVVFVPKIGIKIGQKHFAKVNQAYNHHGRLLKAHQLYEGRNSLFLLIPPSTKAYKIHKNDIEIIAQD